MSKEMVSDRELEIARKVREIHGEHEWSPDDDKAWNGQVEASYMFCQGEDCDLLWLPTQLDYMSLLWDINKEFALLYNGVYRVDVDVCPNCAEEVDSHNHFCGSCKERFAEPDFQTIPFADTPAEAWLKVVVESE